MTQRFDKLTRKIEEGLEEVSVSIFLGCVLISLTIFYTDCSCRTKFQPDRVQQTISQEIKR